MKLLGITILSAGVVIGSLLAGGMGAWWSLALSLGLMVVGMGMIERAEKASGKQTTSLIMWGDS